MQEIPTPSLVLLIGAAGSGKSTFAAHHFRPTEIVSSDACRAMVADDETDQSATRDAFAILRQIARRRLARGLLTVIDATNIHPAARRDLRRLAPDVPAVAIVLDVPEAECLARNAARPHRQVDPAVVRDQIAQLHHTLARLPEEGFHAVLYVQDNEGTP